MAFRPVWLLAALALGLAAPGPLVAELARPAEPGPAFDVRVLRGRARLAQAEAVVALTAADGSHGSSGAASLGLGTAGQAEIAWRALASLRLEGPAELEWGTRAGSGELELIVGGAASLEIEARRTALSLELSHGWRLEVAEAALQLSAEPHGGWVVRHHGGQPVRVRSRVPRADEDWPRVVRPGDEIRLAARRP